MKCASAKEELSRWNARAQAVTIVRDDWGIAHVRSKTDADAVFGLIYAQAEDDFNRVETNYLSALGRLAEAEGQSAIYKDLRVKLFVDYNDLKTRYAASPAWLRELMDAWAAGLNYYLATHREVVPRVIHRYEPWMALSFVEGGVLGDIVRVPVDDLQAFYGKPAPRQAGADRQPAASGFLQECSGSNAFAIAPSHTLEGHALLLINPHPEFYFRAEVQLQSEEGLNCYGAVTWGQFFVFQGFNERLGWAHTISGAGTFSEYAETVLEREGGLWYRHGEHERPVRTSSIEIPYRTAAGTLASLSFTVYRTHHGPIVREADGRWISIAIMHKPVEALTQAFLRMKARNYAEFVKVAELKANSVANAVYADAEGNIAFLPPQFMPRRHDRFDFTQPVNGADPATDWQGEHELEELPYVFNPPNGWIVNTNDEPYGVAGACSPKREAYPRYIDTAGQNPRSVNAARVLKGRQDFTLTSLIAAAYDPYLSAFALLIPDLVSAYDVLPTLDELKDKLAQQIEVLRAWDYRYALDSVATSLAVLWGEQLLKDFEPQARTFSLEIASMFDYLLKGRSSATLTYRALRAIYDHMVEKASPALKLNALAKASDQLVQDFGSWRTPWGEVNRFQRFSGDIAQKFDDSKQSIPVPLTSSIWGALASFKSSRQAHTKRYYGTSGNSFVAAVEFGERVRARAIVAGGASGDPHSVHFNDQAARFATGELREVYFYPDQLTGHTERSYHPGE